MFVCLLLKCEYLCHCLCNFLSFFCFFLCLKSLMMLGSVSLSLVTTWKIAHITCCSSYPHILLSSYPLILLSSYPLILLSFTSNFYLAAMNFQHSRLIRYTTKTTRGNHVVYSPVGYKVCNNKGKGQEKQVINILEKV